MRQGLLVLTMIIGMAADTAAEGSRRYLMLLPKGFSGWACVDFGVAGAPSLPSEGDTALIRVRPGETVVTSDEGGILPMLGRALIEDGGQRQPLPDQVYGRLHHGVTDTNNPVARHCVFFGTEDQADAAGDAPGFPAEPREAHGVSAAEREALVALYEETGGDGWKHRGGWLGPAGTECSWHGVRCEIRFAEPTVVTGLDLFDNNLIGPLPKALEQLSHLERAFLFGNRLEGRIPEALLQRWLAGSLELSAEDALLTDVSEIDYEFSPTSVLCSDRRIVLRSDRSAVAHATRCRKATPDDRTTFCETKTGVIPPGGFGLLAAAIEKSGFYALQPDYSRLVTHGVQERTRVTKGGVVHEVDNYATAGPLELWLVQQAIEGVAANVEWESVTTQPTCLARVEEE